MWRNKTTFFPLTPSNNTTAEIACRWQATPTRTHTHPHSCIRTLSLSLSLSCSLTPATERRGKRLHLYIAGRTLGYSVELHFSLTEEKKDLLLFSTKKVLFLFIYLYFFSSKNDSKMNRFLVSSLFYNNHILRCCAISDLVITLMFFSNSYPWVN